ncbi:MAG TPA: protease modulator HflC, partial [Hyphomicrobium sp.]|nr:protease modulator HflC [Hyphomicrobium sp.]
DFFAFYRSMQAYEQGLKSGDTRLVISPDSDFFRYFADPMGTSPSAAASRTAPQQRPAAPAQTGAPAPAP